MALDRESPPIRMALQLQRRMTENGRLEKYEEESFLYRFLCALLRETERRTGSGNTSLTEQAEIYMRERYQTIQGIEEVARRLGVSPAHLSRCFRKERGISPVEFLTRQKLQSAVNELLGNREKCGDHRPVKTVFSNGNYFRKSLPPVYGRQSRQLSGKTSVRSKNGALQD